MHRSWLALPCLTFVLACPAAQPGDEDVGGTEDESTEGGESGSDTTGSDTTDATTDDTLPEPLATVMGLTADMNGTILTGPGIQLCGPIDVDGNVESCLPAKLSDGGDGSFTVGAPKLGLFALKVVHAPLDGRYFTGQSFQIELAMGDALDFSMPPITIPEATVTDVSGASGPTEIVVEGGLTLTVDPTTSTSPDFSNPTAIGGVDVPAEHWRVSEVEGAPVIKAWSLYPFGTHADEGTEFGIAINDALGLAAGETVTVWGIQKDNGVLHHVADATVNGDATALDLTPVEGLHELAWVLVVD